jgi:hypothetical protein
MHDTSQLRRAPRLTLLRSLGRSEYRARRQNVQLRFSASRGFTGGTPCELGHDVEVTQVTSVFLEQMEQDALE